MSFGGLLSPLGRCLSSLRLLFFRLSTYRMIGYKGNILSLVQVIKERMRWSYGKYQTQFLIKKYSIIL